MFRGAMAETGGESTDKLLCRGDSSRPALAAQFCRPFLHPFNAALNVESMECELTTSRVAQMSVSQAVQQRTAA